MSETVQIKTPWLASKDPEVPSTLSYSTLSMCGRVEEMVRQVTEKKKLSCEEKPAETATKPSRKPTLPEEFKILREHLCRYFHTNVQLTCDEKGKGRITIPFDSEIVLEKLIGILDSLQ